MKKILSLLALLVTTLSAFALDFTDYRKVTMGNNTPTESNDAQLTITDNGNGTYNVTFPNIQVVDGNYTDNYGTFAFTNVSGSTSDDVTTLTGSNLSGTITGSEWGLTSFTEGTLSVKFKDDKAYAEMSVKSTAYYSTFTFNVVFGTDEGWDGGSTGGGETPDPSTWYTVNFDKDLTHSRSDRQTTAIYLQQEGKELQTINTTAFKLYQDLTEQTFTVEAGATVTPSFEFSGVWMHGYVYVDLDDNKQFDVNADDLANSPELVTYSYYKDLNSKGEATSADVNVNPPSFTAPTTPGTYRIRYKIDWDTVDPGGNVTNNHIRTNGGGIWDATLVVTEPEAPEVTVVTEKTFTDAISMVSDEVSVEMGQATVLVQEMSDDTSRMTLTINADEGDYTYSVDELTKTVDADKNRTTYTGKLTIEGDEFNANALVYTEDEVEKLYMVAAGSYFNYVIGTDPDYVAPVTEVSNKTYTSNLRVYDVDAADPVNVVEKDATELNIVKYSDDTYKVTLKDITWNGTATDLVFVGSADSGIMPGELDGEDATEQRTSIMATPDEATAAVLGEGVQAMFEWTEKSETELLMAFYLQVGTTTYAGEFNYEKQDPVTPSEVNVVEPGFQPNGASWSQEGVDINWDEQYVVAQLDLSTCKTSTVGPENVLAIGTDLTGWSTGPHYLFYYNKADKVLQYNYLHNANKSLNGGNANLSRAYIQLTDEVVTIELSKQEGLKVNGKSELVKYVSTANSPSTNGTESWTTDDLESVFSGLWELNTIGFGGCQGSTMSNATYNYIKVVPLEKKEPVTPFEPTTKTATDVAYTTFNGTTTNYDAKTVEVTEYEQDKYKVTYKQLTAGTTTLGDLTIDGVTATVGEDNTVTLSTEATEATWSNVEDFATIYFGMENGSTTAINGFAATYTLNDAQEIEKLNLTFNFDIKGEEAKVVFGEQAAPELPEPTVYTDKAHTTYWGDFDYTDKVVNVYDLGENKYKVVYKEFNLGSSTTFDLVFNNVEGTTDEDGYTTYTFDGTATTENVTVESGVIASVNEGGEVDATLNGKSKDGKLYATFTMTTMGSTATTVYGSEFTTPEEPKDDYAINFDKDGQNNHSSRRTTSVSLQQEGKDVQTLTFNSSLNGYEDHSADMEFSVEAGSEVATTFGYNGEWMHGYVYIDLDDNKQFDVVADDLANSPELVAYSYYSGYNSKGEAAANSVNVTPPTFTAPATPGTYRIRFKIDWDNVDPGGCVDAGNHILNNGGGIWDATLKVTEPVVDGISTVNAAVAAGEAELYTIDGVKLNKLQKGLNIVRTADGKVKKMLVK